MVHIRPGLRPAFDNIRDILQMYIIDSLNSRPAADQHADPLQRHWDLWGILLRGWGDPRGMFIIATPPSGSTVQMKSAGRDCARSGSRTSRKQPCKQQTGLLARQPDNTWDSSQGGHLHHGQVSREKQGGAKMKANAYYTLSIDSTCDWGIEGDHPATSVNRSQWSWGQQAADWGRKPAWQDGEDPRRDKWHAEQERQEAHWLFCEHYCFQHDKHWQHDKCYQHMEGLAGSIMEPGRKVMVPFLVFFGGSEV